MSPPPPTLPDELVEEIYLRLPPDEPACLVRASLASKLWLGILTGPRFTARYRDFHGAPPMLGFCPILDDRLQQKLDPAIPYFSTTKFGPRIPEHKGWGRSQYYVLDCRHGRLLLERGRLKPTPTPFILWDPMTGCRREMRAEVCLRNGAAAVLCAVTGCDHRACQKGPSLVVYLGVGDETDSHTEFFVRTWSSQTGQWSDPCYCDLPLYAYILVKPSVLIGDALFYMIHYPGQGEENHEDMLIGFVMYQLGSSTLSMLHAPPLPGSVNVFAHNYIHMAMEDGSLGFAHVDNSALYLCSRRTDSDADEPWTQRTVIHLDKLLPIQNPCKPLEPIGSVEGWDIIFVAADVDVYEIHLNSLECKKLCKSDKLHALIPYMSFYHPRGTFSTATTTTTTTSQQVVTTATTRGRSRGRGTGKNSTEQAQSSSKGTGITRKRRAER